MRLVPSLVAALWLASPAVAGQDQPLQAERRALELLAAHALDARTSTAEFVASSKALGTPSVLALLEPLGCRAVWWCARVPLVPLRPESVEAIHAVFAGLGIAKLRPHLQGSLRGSPTKAEVLAVFEVLGRIGSVRDLVLFEEASRSPASRDLDPGILRGLDEALARLIARDPSGITHARSYLLSAPPHFVCALARAIASSGAPEAFEALASPIGFDDALDRMLLPCLVLASGRPAEGVDESLLDILRAHAQSSDAMLARAAVAAAGTFEDSASVPILVPLLESEDLGLREAAHTALRRITGLGFPCQSARWVAWYEVEELWVRTQSESVTSRLGSRRPADVVRALQEIATHPLERHALAERVAEVLQHHDPQVRRLACSVLGRLASVRSAAALENVLGDADPRVAEEARAALRSIAQSRSFDPAALSAAGG